MLKFNPLNEVIKKNYEEGLLHGLGRDHKTVRAAWHAINLFESFTKHANFKSFSKEQVIDFKRWLESQHNQKGELLSVSSVQSILHNLKAFFQWLAIQKQFIGKIDSRAISYLQLSTGARRAARASKQSTPPTLEQVQAALMAMPNTTDVQKRNRGLFALTILTCARDKALVTLKIKDIDPITKTLWQNPKHVETKGRKSIHTAFLSGIVPWAEEAFLEWFNHATQNLGFKPNDPLFPKTAVAQNSKTLAFEVIGLENNHWTNTQPVREIFGQAFKAVNLPYFHPHLFRKTIVKWALKNCTQQEFKAISQNIGHEDAMTTYNAYGNLTPDEQFTTVKAINQRDYTLSQIPQDALMAELQRRMGK